PLGRSRSISPGIRVSTMKLDAPLPDVAVDVVREKRRRPDEGDAPDQREDEAEAQAAARERGRLEREQVDRERETVEGQVRGYALRLIALKDPRRDASRQRRPRGPEAGRHPARPTACRAIVPRILAPASTLP